ARSKIACGTSSAWRARRKSQPCSARLSRETSPLACGRPEMGRQSCQELTACISKRREAHTTSIRSATFPPVLEPTADPPYPWPTRAASGPSTFLPPRSSNDCGVGADVSASDTHRPADREDLHG